MLLHSTGWFQIHAFLQGRCGRKAKASSPYSLSFLLGRGINRPQANLCNSILFLLHKGWSYLEFIW